MRRRTVRKGVPVGGEIDGEGVDREGATDVDGERRRRRIDLAAERRQGVVVERNDLRFVELNMGRIKGVGVECNRSMGMRRGVVLVSFAAVIVMGRDMRVRRRPLHRQEGGQQEKQESGVDALFEHEERWRNQAMIWRTSGGELYAAPPL